MFPKTMQIYGELLAPDVIVTVKGRVDGRDDTPKLMAMEITRPEILLDSGPPVRLRVRAGALTDDRVDRLHEILARASGRQPGVRAPRRRREGDGAAARRRVLLRPARNGLFAELRILFGADCIV